MDRLIFIECGVKSAYVPGIKKTVTNPAINPHHIIAIEQDVIVDQDGGRDTPTLRLYTVSGQEFEWCYGEHDREALNNDILKFMPKASINF